MQLYFFGLDKFNVVSEGKDLVFNDQNQNQTPENPQFITKPVLINKSFKNVCSRFNLFVYQLIGNRYSWFIRGDGIQSELFSSDLQISKVCISASSIVGWSSTEMTLYKVNLVLSHETQTLTQSQPKEVKLSHVRLKQIFTNDKAVYVLDDTSKIFEVGDVLKQKWHLEGVAVTKVEAGFGHFIALSDTGALYSWGSGGRGELGHYEHDHVMVNCELPKRIEFFDDLPCIVKDFSCGGWHTIALTSEGDAYSWGWNESGQLGHSGEKLSAVGGVPFPIDLGSGNDPIVQIIAGTRHSIAVLKSGELFSWGLNKHGELGVGDLKNRTEPTKLKDLHGPLEIHCGRWCTFVYTS